MSSFATTQLFTNATVNCIVSSVASCHNCILLLFHICTIIYSSKQETGQKLHRTQWLSVFSITMMTVLPISVLCLYLIDMYQIHNLYCSLNIQIGIISYLCSKFALYILLLERLFIIFSNSEYRLNKYLIHIIRLIIGLLFIFSMVLIMITQISHIDANGLCLPNIPMDLKGYFLCLDLSVSMFVLILFSRKLLLLSLNMSSNLTTGTTNTSKPIHKHPSKHRSLSISSLKIASENLDQKLLKVMKKTNLLGIIALLTTQLSIIISTVLRGNLWIMVDSMVNCWCILLMFQSYNKIFNCLCQCLLCFIPDQCTMCACFWCCCMVDAIDKVEIDPNVQRLRMGTSTPCTETRSNNGSTPNNILQINGIHHINISSNTIEDIYEDAITIPITPQSTHNNTVITNTMKCTNENGNTQNDHIVNNIIENDSKIEKTKDLIEIPNINNQQIYTYHRNSTHL